MRQYDQMAHQDRADALTLIGVNHDEGDFGLAWLDDDISAATHNSRSSNFVDLRYECDMGVEIDIEKERYFLL